MNDPPKNKYKTLDLRNSINEDNPSAKLLKMRNYDVCKRLRYHLKKRIAAGCMQQLRNNLPR